MLCESGISCASSLPCLMKKYMGMLVSTKIRIWVRSFAHLLTKLAESHKDLVSYVTLGNNVYQIVLREERTTRNEVGFIIFIYGNRSDFLCSSGTRYPKHRLA